MRTISGQVSIALGSIARELRARDRCDQRPARPYPQRYGARATTLPQPHNLRYLGDICLRGRAMVDVFISYPRAERAAHFVDMIYS